MPGEDTDAVTEGTYLGVLIPRCFISTPEGLLLRRHLLPRVSRSACLLPPDTSPDTALIPASLELMNSLLGCRHGAWSQTILYFTLDLFSRWRDCAAPPRGTTSSTGV